MKKNKFSLYFIFVSILTCVTVISSIIYKSYFNFRKPQALVENNALLKDFNPDLDLSILSTIESKNKNINESFDYSIIKSNVHSNASPIPTPITVPTLQPTIAPTTAPISEPILAPTGSSDVKMLD